MVRCKASGKVQPFDLEAMLARCLGKPELVGRALARFESVVKTDLEELEKAIGRTEATEIARIAHRLKGASANVSAVRLQARAAELEELTLARKVEDIQSCFERLRMEVAHFSEYTASLGQPGEGLIGAGNP